MGDKAPQTVVAKPALSTGRSMGRRLDGQSGLPVFFARRERKIGLNPAREEHSQSILLDINLPESKETRA